MNVVHIGLPKTATTTLQNRLFSEIQDFAYVGRINNGYSNADTRELIERITNQDSLEYKSDRAAALLRSLPEVRMAPQKPILVSAEGLSVEGRADRRLIAERLRELFAPAKILIVLRAQPALLQSMYLNHLRGSGERFLSFEKWLEDIYGGVRFRTPHRVGLDFEALITLYDHVFGPENVVVLPFEWIRDMHSQFSSRLGDLVGMNAPEVNKRITAHSDNQRLSRRHLWALRMQGLLAQGTNLATVGRRILPGPIYQIIRRTVVAGSRVPSPTMPDRWTERLQSICAAGNARIARAKDIPLGSLGYPVEH